MNSNFYILIKYPTARRVTIKQKSILTLAFTASTWTTLCQSAVWCSYIFGINFISLISFYFFFYNSDT